MNGSTTSARWQHGAMAHPAWEAVLEEWREAGLARELDPVAMARWMVTAPTPAAQAVVLAAHYHAGADPVERAWRAQSDRVLEMPDAPTAPELLASATQLVVPEMRVGVRPVRDGLEVRIAPENALLETTSARVVVRRMQRHLRRGLSVPVSLDGLPPRSFVYAMNVLLDSQGIGVRFVPLVAVPGRRAWMAATLPQALRLEALGTLANDEPWRELARFSAQLALAS